MTYDAQNRRLKGGMLHFTQQDGSTRTLKIDVLSDTGFHIGAGLYFGYKGFHHGSWRGELNIEGEYIPDCAQPEAARELHQIRDCIIRITDGDTVGWGNYQTIILGDWPAFGVTADNNFI
jgi:hypothetical protein